MPSWGRAAARPHGMSRKQQYSRANRLRRERERKERAEAEAAEAARVAQLSDTEVSVPSAGRVPRHNHTSSVSGMYMF
eukprot:SAG31_NODE_117_length_24022_cov_6.878067_5_plen_78_part_00